MKTDKKNQSGKVINRRHFFAKSALAGIGVSVGSTLFAESKKVDSNSGKANETLSINEKRKLGSLEVSPIGLGCMSMTSGHYNPSRPKNEMIKVIRGALDLGVTFFDTAEYYGPFTDEEVVGEALSPVRDQVVIASKFGFKFENGKSTGRDSRPESIRKAS